MRYQQNLKSAREKHGFSQKEIADLLQTSQQQYSRWESGEFQMPIETYKVIADIYKISIDELCDYKSRFEREHEKLCGPFEIITTEEQQREYDEKIIEELFELAEDRKKELKYLIAQYTEELEYLEKHW